MSISGMRALRTGAPHLRSSQHLASSFPAQRPHWQPVQSQDSRRSFSAAAAVDSRPQSGQSIKYLYDGSCKVCLTFKSALEVEDPGEKNIDFVNIDTDDFDPKQHNGITYDDAMSTIHAITAQGKTVKGPNAVKELFEAAGPRLGIIGVAAKLPGFNFLFGTLYDAVSHNRFAISKGATKVQKTVKGEK